MVPTSNAPPYLWNTDPMVLYRCKVPGQRIGHDLNHTTHFHFAHPLSQSVSQFIHSFIHSKLCRKLKQTLCRIVAMMIRPRNCDVL